MCLTKILIFFNLDKRPRVNHLADWQPTRVFFLGKEGVLGAPSRGKATATRLRKPCIRVFKAHVLCFARLFFLSGLRRKYWKAVEDDALLPNLSQALQKQGNGGQGQFSGNFRGVRQISLLTPPNLNTCYLYNKLALKLKTSNCSNCSNGQWNLPAPIIIINSPTTFPKQKAKSKKQKAKSTQPSATFGKEPTFIYYVAPTIHFILYGRHYFEIYFDLKMYGEQPT